MNKPNIVSGTPMMVLMAMTDLPKGVSVHDFFSAKVSLHWAQM
jgi:hypothetical protein